MNKEDILKNLKQYKLDNQKFIIIGSAPLVLKGIKDSCHDIDLAVSKETNDFLLKNYDCKLEKTVEGHDVYITKDLIHFSTHYYGDFKGEMYEGYLMQTPEEILKLKRSLNRKKDMADINLILDYLNIQNNSLALAYLGDAVYELYIRKYLTKKGNYKVKDLQAMAVNYVSAKAQSNFLDKLLENNFLTEEEINVVKRARNHKVLSHPKNTSIIVYKKATGLEALLGFHEIKNNTKRTKEIMKYIVGD